MVRSLYHVVAVLQSSTTSPRQPALESCPVSKTDRSASATADSRMQSGGCVSAADATISRLDPCNGRIMIAGEMGATRLFLPLIVSLCVCGCRYAGRDTGKANEPVQTTTAAGFPQVWDAAQDVLRAQRLPLDRVNRRTGRLTTFPVTSQHFFEFWRHDVATRYDFWEATLRLIRRRVVVTVDPSPGAAQRAVSVVVKKERFSSPDRQFNSSAAAYHFFRDSLPAARTGAPISESDSGWLDDGSDPALARRILDAIVAEAVRRNEAGDPPTNG